MKFELDSFSLMMLATRILDLLISLVGLLATSPLVLLIVIALRFSGEGEVFYRQVRIGKGGRTFNLLKFATMQKNSPYIGSGELTLPNDSRVLPLGRILRKTKLNELPQLWNIVVGDLSLVGPRPQTKHYYDLYAANDLMWINTVRPGLSGVGSIIFRNEENILSKVDDPITFDEQVITPYKGKVEHWFVLNQSIVLYLEIIFITMLVVVWPSCGIQKRLLRRVPAPPAALSILLEN